MRPILRQSERGAIFRPAPVVPPRGKPVRIAHYTRTAGEVLSFPQQPNLNWWEDLPDHDWGQHGLGDPDEWAEENGWRQIDAALDASGNHTFPGMEQMQPTGNNMGSTHEGTERMVHPNGESWIVKTPPAKRSYQATGDVVANTIQAHSGLRTPPTFLTTNNGTPASAQLEIPSKAAFPNKQFDPEKLSDDDLETVQKHHALDWLLGNHDAHGNQFIRDNNDGALIGIDKGQAFKHYNQDRLSWNYHPNGAYNETEPVYNTLYRNYAQGGRQVNDPRTGPVGAFIQHLQDTPDDEYSNVLRPYAEEAAQRGALGKQHGGYEGHDPNAHFTPNDVEGFLNYAVQRKNNLMNDMGDLHDRATAMRMTGTKIALRKMGAYPMPHQMEPMDPGGMDLGSHGAQLYGDQQGQWIVKKPKPGNEFMVPLDVGTDMLARRGGLKMPETYAVPMGDGLATASKRIPGATQAFGGSSGRKPPKFKHLQPGDLETIQKHQALDWLIGNHDAHVGNFLRDPSNGELVGIDKGQATKYYGRDRLSPTFHPNFYAREPIYNSLWRQHIRGEGQMNDPTQGEVGKFVQNLQSIPDDDLRAMFGPYAHAAAHAGRLVNVSDPKPGQSKPTPGYVLPDRKLGRPSIPPNDPDAFLNAMVARKNNLSRDLGHFYGKINAARDSYAKKQQKALQSPSQPQYGGPQDPGLHMGKIHRESVGLPNLPKIPAVPTPKPLSGLGPTPNSTTPPTPTVPGMAPANSGPQTNMVQQKGYNPADQSHWNAMGISTGIPSAYNPTQSTLSQMDPEHHHFGYGNPAGPAAAAASGDGGYSTGRGGPPAVSGGSPATPATTPGASPTSPVTPSPTGGAPGSSGASGGSEAQERARIHQVMGPEFAQYNITNPQVQQHMEDQVYSQGVQESGWRDIPQGNIGDINNAKGTPAMGPLQYVPSTQSGADALTHYQRTGDPFVDQIHDVLPLEVSEGKVDPNSGFTDKGGSGVGFGHGWG